MTKTHCLLSRRTTSKVSSTPVTVVFRLQRLTVETVHGRNLAERRNQTQLTAVRRHYDVEVEQGVHLEVI
jgi:hypothetical protein